MKIDWNEAPEWAIGHALHVSGGGDIKEVWVGEEKYQRLDQQKAFCYGGGEGDSHHNPRRYQFKYETLRPTAWTGEGLPPVGTVCWYGDLNEELRIITHVDQGEQNGSARYLAVGQNGEMGSLRLVTAEYWHPIRTPEQIAAETEEREALEIQKVIAPFFDNPMGAAFALHKAGYRKAVKP